MLKKCFLCNEFLVTKYNTVIPKGFYRNEDIRGNLSFKKKGGVLLLMKSKR